MTITTATPYLIVNGRARRALALYEHALGATTESLQRYVDIDRACPEEMRELVMHAVIRFGHTRLMLSDGSGPAPVPTGGSVSVALEFDDAEQMHRSFAALAETGTIVQDIFRAPWDALFGIVTDELGVTWMCNCAQ
jgi:PhnB protein